MEHHNLFNEIKLKSQELGFDEIGVSGLENFEFSSNKLREFVKKNYHGDMSWLKDKLDIRSNPKNIWNDAKSAIVLGMNYGPDNDIFEDLREKSKGYISVYSRRKDYHKVIKSKLKILAAYIKKIQPSEIKVFVDTAPLMEKPLASFAGLGWTGKHTNLVSKEFGSWLFLGVVLVNIDINIKSYATNNCGSCTKCINICPTKAIIESYILDARKCISYLTIEHKDHIAKKFRKKIGNRIFGCDDCLAICPWNKFAKKTKEVKLTFIEKLRMPNLKDFLKFKDEDYRLYFAGTPIRRLGYFRFMRNVLIAVANSNDNSLINEVLKKLDSENTLIRAMAIWAIFCLDESQFYVERNKRLKYEKDQKVRDEWLNGEQK
ncbi:MAG: tRNA epoxyqueuosine(34) reductase QueG [Rickettsiales bacterium]|nr:tRNA epoxyqueuosine(34) reductase QueG [Rickettsiales bacterium]OUV80990.1 MAG: tRNA epoxyqueuosine(34) reductase QueG [Rickettsiales bacterium TMED131]